MHGDVDRSLSGSQWMVNFGYPDVDLERTRDERQVSTSSCSSTTSSTRARRGFARRCCAFLRCVGAAARGIQHRRAVGKANLRRAIGGSAERSYGRDSTPENVVPESDGHETADSERDRRMPRRAATNCQAEAPRKRGRRPLARRLPLGGEPRRCLDQGELDQPHAFRQTLGRTAARRASPATRRSILLVFSDHSF